MGYRTGAASGYAANAGVNHLQAILAAAAGGPGQALGGQVLGGNGTGYDYEDDCSDEYGDHDNEEEAYMGGYQQPRVVAPAVAPRPVNQKDLAQDKLYTSALEALAQLLPRPDHPDANIYDYLPHEALPSLLVASTLGDLLSELLRNDR